MGIMSTKDLAGTVAELSETGQARRQFILLHSPPSFCMPDACWVRDPDGKLLYEAVDNYFTEGWWPSDLANPVRERGMQNQTSHAEQLHKQPERAWVQCAPYCRTTRVAGCSRPQAAP